MTHRTSGGLRVLTLAAFAAGPLCAQAPYTFSLPDLSVGPTGTFAAGVYLDSSSGGAVHGGSFSVCHDLAIIEAQSVDPGAGLAALNGGAGPGFFTAGTETSGIWGGWLVDFTGSNTVPPTVNFEMATIEYSIQSPGTTTPLEFCLAGAPPVTNVVSVDGASISPLLVDGSATIADPAGIFVLELAPTSEFGSPLTATVAVQSTGPWRGIRFGLRHGSQIAAVGAEPATPLEAVNGGAGPELFVVDLSPAGGPGITVVCILDTTTPFATIPAGFTEAVDFLYSVPATAICSTVDFEFRDDLGSPPVPLEVVFVPGAQPAGGIASGTVIVPSAPGLPSGGKILTVGSVGAAPGSSVTVPVDLDTDEAVQAFSFGIEHSDPAVLLASIEPGVALLGLGCPGGGGGHDFFGSLVLAGGTIGGLVVAAIDTNPIGTPVVLDPGSDLELVRLTYDVPANQSAPVQIALTGSLGAPPLAIELTIGFTAVVPITVPGGITMGGSFIRGECNGDGSFDIADPIAFLSALFPGPGTPFAIPCEDACDANDDGTLNIADAVASLAGLFGGTSLPPPAACGGDATSGDPLGCDASGCP